MTFPGDALVADPLMVVDRYARFDAAPADVWPWLVQIGKGRGGWYMPRAVERFVPRGRRGVRSLSAALQDVAVGTSEPDWGPGDPEFRCAVFEPERALVWYSLRDPVIEHRWPDAIRPDVLQLTWALLLSEDSFGGTRLHVRLRVHKEAWREDPGYRLKAAAGDFFDWLTIVALFAGLRERLA